MPVVETVGQRFGRLTVISEHNVRSPGGGYPKRCRVRCDCGNEYETWASTLFGPNCPKSCGCLRPDGALGPSDRDSIVGQKFTKLLVLSQCNDGHPSCECLCDCGKTITAKPSALKNGNKVSCGCWKRSARRKTPEEAVPASLWHAYKQGALRRGLSFDLTKDEFKALILSPCHYCGAVGSCKTKIRKHVLARNGVDRIDSDQGYSRTNCVPCCEDCNTAKDDLPVEMFLGWAHRVSAHQAGLVNTLA
jgi:5-methylcytosine-specific restriction endonuclease McrA